MTGLRASDADRDRVDVLRVAAGDGRLTVAELDERLEAALSARTLSELALDFTDAVIMHDTLRIDMNMRGGSLTLVAGPGIVVEADSLAGRYTEVNISPGAKPGEPVVLRV